MSEIFDALPKVNYCCFCIHLKAACIMICIVEMILYTALYFIEVDCYFNTLQKILNYLIMVCDATLAFASIVFFIGVILNKRITAIIYLWVLLCTVTIRLLTAIFDKIYMAFIGEYDVTYFGCDSDFLLIATLIGVALGIYYMIIVRCHKDSIS